MLASGRQPELLYVPWPRVPWYSASMSFLMTLSVSVSMYPLALAKPVRGLQQLHRLVPSGLAGDRLCDNELVFFLLNLDHRVNLAGVHFGVVKPVDVADPRHGVLDGWL